MAKAPENMPLVDKESQVKEEPAEPAEKEETLDDFPLKYTTTDAAILACSRLKHSEKMSRRDVFGFLTTFLLHLATQGIQILLLWLMFSGPVETYEDPYEEAQFNTMANALKNATAGNTILGAPPANQTLDIALATYTHARCKGNTSSLGVHLIFLVLWFGISWDAASTTCHRFVVLFKIPTTDPDALMDTNSGIDLSSAPEKGNHDITHLSVVWKIFISLFILLPHTLTVLFLIWTGTKMQAFAPTVLVQAKASLKLGVITTISGNIMTWFGSAHMHKYMGVDEENKETPVAVNYRMEKAKGKPKGLAALEASQAWMTWGETMFKFIAGLIFCIFIVFYWFDKFVTFNNLCGAYYEKVGCSAPVGTAGLSAAAKAICPTRPVQDWLPGFYAAGGAVQQ